MRSGEPAARRPEDLLDLALEALERGQDPEPLLAAHPELAEEVRPLLEVACRLRSLPARSATASGLMRVLARVATQEVRRGKGRQEGLLSRAVLVRVAAVVLALSLVGWATGAASTGTVPGDLLYPVKRLGERVKFMLTIDQEGRAELRLVFSEKRLAELLKKYSRGGGLDERLVGAMLEEGARAMEVGPRLSEESRTLLISRLGYLSEHQRVTLEALQQRVDSEERRRLAPYVEACRRRHGSMRRMMARFTPAEPGSDPPPSNLLPAPPPWAPVYRVTEPDPKGGGWP